jgi:hypothetical protein
VRPKILEISMTIVNETSGPDNRYRGGFPNTESRQCDSSSTAVLFAGNFSNGVIPRSVFPLWFLNCYTDARASRSTHRGRRRRRWYLPQEIWRPGLDRSRHLSGKISIRLERRDRGTILAKLHVAAA